MCLSIVAGVVRFCRARHVGMCVGERWWLSVDTRFTSVYMMFHTHESGYMCQNIILSQPSFSVINCRKFFINIVHGACSAPVSKQGDDNSGLDSGEGGGWLTIINNYPVPH